MKFARNDHVRVVGEPKGSINEFARVVAVYPNGTYWISSANMPYCGTLNEIVSEDRIISR